MNESFIFETEVDLMGLLFVDWLINDHIRVDTTHHIAKICIDCRLNDDPDAQPK